MIRVGQIRLVAGREISERVRGKAIWVSTALTTALVVGFIVIPALVRAPARPVVIGLVGPGAQTLGTSVERVAETAGTRIRISDLSSLGAARSALEAGTLDVSVEVQRSSVVVTADKSVSPAVQGVLAAAVNRAHLGDVLGTAGVPAGVITQALAPPPLSVDLLNPAPPDKTARSVAALVAGLLLVYGLGIAGGLVAAGVAQEKTSRTAEVLLSALRPAELLAGKVIGIGSSVLGALLVAVGAGLIANAAVQRAEIPATVWVLLPAILLWFLLGYVFYALVFAAAGALVARQEEVQLTTGPVAIPLFVALALTYAAIGNPDAWWIRVLSFLPPLAPVLQPVRIALGHVAPWEPPVAVVLVLGAIFLILRVAARIYSVALVRGGARLGWRAAMRSASPAPPI